MSIQIPNDAIVLCETEEDLARLYAFCVEAGEEPVIGDTDRPLHFLEDPLLGALRTEKRSGVLRVFQDSPDGYREFHDDCYRFVPDGWFLLTLDDFIDKCGGNEALAPFDLSALL